MPDTGIQTTLYSLGWATINSLWQMGLIWSLFHILSFVLDLRNQQRLRYQIGLSSVVTGMCWFTLTLIQAYTAPLTSQVLLFGIEWQQRLLQQVLSTASVIYIILLMVPLYRLFREWRSVQLLRTTGQQKAPVEYRGFVRQMSQTFNIRGRVEVYLSSLVQSPVTIGFLKPLILLPLALPNHLTLEQAETILLHEISHIRRNDFLVNLMLCIVRTVFYFNPFMNMLIDSIEADREHACDRQVLDFGYNPLEYATALVKLSQARSQLCIAATGSGSLRIRIERILGRKPAFTWRKYWVAAAFSLLLILNCFRFRELRQDTDLPVAFAGTAYYAPQLMPVELSAKKPAPAKPVYKAAMQLAPVQELMEQPAVCKVDLPEAPAPALQLTSVAYNENAAMSPEEKKQVANAVKDTREVLTNLSWSKAQEDMGELLTSGEKLLAQMDYTQQLDSAAQWDKLEHKLISNYKNIDWDGLTARIKQMKDQQLLEDMIGGYESLSESLQEMLGSGQLRDSSMKSMNELRRQLDDNIKRLKTLRDRPVIKL